MFSRKIFGLIFIKTLFLGTAAIIAGLSFLSCTPKAQEDIFSSIGKAPTISQPHENPPVADKALEITKSLMDRTMLYSFFTDIFGPSAIGTPGLKTLKLVKDEKAILAGPCSVYDTFRSVGDTGALSTDAKSINCPNNDTASGLAAPMQPAANVLHQAMINNICTEAIDLASTYNYLMEQLKEYPTLLIATNTPENVLKLFKLFYRGKPQPDASLIESLRFLIGFPATESGWKNAILTTCVSSHWQAL